MRYIALLVYVVAMAHLCSQLAGLALCMRASKRVTLYGTPRQLADLARDLEPTIRRVWTPCYLLRVWRKWSHV